MKHIKKSNIDAFIPSEMAEKAEDAGVTKVNLNWKSMMLLAVLAGAFIALGSVFYTTITAGLSSEIPYGLTKLIGGVVFCLGLILVVIAGAELFTGNALIIMAWAAKKISTAKILRNWGIVYLGNFIGAILTVVLIFVTSNYFLNDGLVGKHTLDIALSKCQLGFVQAISLGIMCNALVCLAVWLCLSARSTTDKILSIIFPITAFVAMGFEHSIANMYFVPAGLFLKEFATTEFWTLIGQLPTDYTQLNFKNFIVNNLFPVTIGNIIGGGGLVGGIYWYIYRRPL